MVENLEINMCNLGESKSICHCYSILNSLVQPDPSHCKRGERSGDMPYYDLFKCFKYRLQTLASLNDIHNY